MKNNIVLGGLIKSSLIDYPEKISAIVFTQGCNFCCSYCHNPELTIVDKPKISPKEIFDFLKTRINKLDGIVITGGEPTMQQGLKWFIEKIKEMNFLVKLDTNGINPTILEELVSENLIDYVAMDIKAPLEKYYKITKTNGDITNIKKSIDFLKQEKIDYEFRTTVVKELLTYQDFEEIGSLIHGAKKYYLQKFVPSKLLDESFKNCTTYSDEEFEQIIEILKNKVQYVGLR